MKALLLLTTLACYQFTTVSAVVNVHAANTAFEALARTVTLRGKLTITNYNLEGDSTNSTMELERFGVWDEDAQVYVNDMKVSPPRHLYFKGYIADEPGSSVMLSVREDGGSEGMVFRPGGVAWAIGKPKGKSQLKSKKANKQEINGVTCGNDHLEDSDGKSLVSHDAILKHRRKLQLNYSPNSVINSTYVANVAVDSNVEFCRKVYGATTIPNSGASKCLTYIGDIIGYADVTFSRDLNTDLVVGWARVFTTSKDPYSSTTDSNVGLNEFRNHWSTKQTTVKRTIALMMSGNGSGGVAWRGVACDSYWWDNGPSTCWAYAYAGSMGSNKFSWDGNQQHNPAYVVWDIFVVQHELGHSFNAPHTHDMCNVPDSISPNDRPVDNCGAGCDSSTSNVLPSCSGSTPWYHNSGGKGAGTLMSYCYIVSGASLDDISMTFGKNHPCGVVPNRMTDMMRTFIDDRAAYYPDCFRKPV